MKKHIRSIKKDILIDSFVKNGIERYRATQVFSWVHKKHELCVDSMTNINKDMRKYLSESYDFYEPIIEKEYASKIDDTKKYLIRLYDDNIIETVLMTYEYGKTLCVSTQVGCNMGCKFCASTIGGKKRDLDAYEILSQVYAVEDREHIRINNIVVMGIGEPLGNMDNLLDFIDILNDEDGDNISKRNITVSTCGIVPNIIRLANDNNKFTLALSLHAPSDEIRHSIMPISHRYNIDETLDAMALYYKNTNRR
ncbi:MAG: radical SAM protein, partial [Lachnospiraceae bacterium]|nr:radical SAM protein [Lachnospiraceae bacterium]